MKKQLEQMQTELREMMIYNAPEELGALWTDVSVMMKSMGGDQTILLKKKMQADERAAARRRAMFKHYMEELTYGMFAFVMALTIILMMTYVSYDRKQRWPELEPAILKQKQEQRRKEYLIWLQTNQERQQKEDQEFNQRQREFIATQREKETTSDAQLYLDILPILQLQ
jgi:hypothetical protein